MSKQSSEEWVPYYLNSCLQVCFLILIRTSHDKNFFSAEKRFLARCLDKIEDRRELIAPAKCVVMARKRLLKMKSEMTQKHRESTTPRPNQHWKSFLQQFDDFDRLHSFSQPHSLPQSQTQTRAPGFGPQFRVSGKRQHLFSRTRHNFGATPLSPRKPQNGYFRDTEIRRAPPKHTPLGQHSSFIQSAPTPKPVVQRRKGYERFNLLSKNLKKLSHLDFSIPNRRIRKRPTQISRRFLRFKHRSKRQTRFADSKDGYYKEEKFKVSRAAAIFTH